MKMVSKSITSLGLALLLASTVVLPVASQVAFAQSDQLLGTAYAMQLADDPAEANNTILLYTEQPDRVGGDILSADGAEACGPQWQAKMQRNGDSLHFSELATEGEARDCFDAAQFTRFSAALQRVRAFHATKDGIELRDAAGKIVFLLVAAG